MTLLQTSLIWIGYAIALAVLIAVASVFVFIYQTPRDRSLSVSLTCIFAITALLGTLFLLPVDVAFVSSTNSIELGRPKDWATQEEVAKIISSLKVVYYFLYSLDAFLCLVAIPFSYFCYEEYDEVAAEAGEQTLGHRFRGALKYTISFIAILVVLFIVGFFTPVSKDKDFGDGLDFFKKLLTENRGERALTFTVGLLTTIGLFLYILYTPTGLALLPISLIKTAPSFRSQNARETTEVQLEFNRERQRQLQGRCGGNVGLLSSKDRRELDTLAREERTLIRRQRLENEPQEGTGGRFMKEWLKIQAFFRPFKLLVGVVLFMATMLMWISMLLTGVDKAKNSLCKHRCGYILGHANLFNPINWILMNFARVFPVDYIIFTALMLLLFCSTVFGIASTGIQLLFVRIFQIRPGHTSPQALLLTTAILMLSILALNYSISMIVAPQYSTFGPQTFCDRAPSSPGEYPDCSSSKHLVKPCSEVANGTDANKVCIPTVLSTFLNRLTLNFPFFGAILFWAQFAFLGIYIIVTVTALLRSPKVDERQLEEDSEEAEEESLLASSRRPTVAT